MMHRNDRKTRDSKNLTTSLATGGCHSLLHWLPFLLAAILTIYFIGQPSSLESKSKAIPGQLGNVTSPKEIADLVCIEEAIIIGWRTESSTTVWWTNLAMENHHCWVESLGYQRLPWWIFQLARLVHQSVTEWYHMERYHTWNADDPCFRWLPLNFMGQTCQFTRVTLVPGIYIYNILYNPD